MSKSINHNHKQNRLSLHTAIIATIVMFAVNGYGDNNSTKSGGTGSVGRVVAYEISDTTDRSSGFDAVLVGVGGLKQGESIDLGLKFVKTGQSTGGRSRASIQRVVMRNMTELRSAYSKGLREKPGLNGKITVKFAIDEFGKVIFVQLVESTMDDSEFEKTVVDRVKSWAFEKIDKPGDVTEVVYPFVFSE